MANDERLGASFSIDITNLKSGLAQANRLIKESNSEFQAAAAGMDDWTESEEGLNAKIKSLNQIAEIQRKKVEALQKEYNNLIDDGMDPTSKQAVELRTKINNETAALNKSETEIKKQSEALENLSDKTKEAGNATDNAGEKFKGLKAAGGVAVTAIAAIGTACVAAVTSFLKLAESTRETRENMAKLETSFATAGHSAEDAANTYTELYGILGDEGQATEAAAHLAKLTNNQQELSEWTDICTGVYATFGDSLPIEGLTEAANETAKTGSITGVLADALNWAGVSEDDFQTSLDACTSEQERQALITSTLNGLYSDAAETYKEVNGDVIDAQKATANLNSAMAELGAIAEPIMTSLKTIATDLLSSVMPSIQLMGEGLAGALNGTTGAADSLAEGLTGLISTALEKIVDLVPDLISAIVAIVPEVATAIIAQLPTVISTILDVLIEAFPQVFEAALELLMALVDAIPDIIQTLYVKLPLIISTITGTLLQNLPTLISAAVQLWMGLVSAIPQMIPQLVAEIPTIISNIVDGLAAGAADMANVGKDLIRGLWNGINDMVGWIGEKIQGFGASILSSLKSFFGIASPSKVMANVVGKNLALGIGQGFEDNIDGVNDEIQKAMNIGNASVSVNANAVNGNSALGSVNNFYQTNNFDKTKSRYDIYVLEKKTAALVRSVGGGVYA